jgi:hypothetical protein
MPEKKEEELKQGDILKTIVKVPRPIKEDPDNIEDIPLGLKIISIGRSFMNVEWFGGKPKPKLLEKCEIIIEEGKYKIHRILTAKKVVIKEAV